MGNLFYNVQKLEIRKAKKEVRDRTKNMKAMEYFWGMGYITVALFAILQNGAFHSGNLNGDNYGNNKTIQKMWNEISQIFLIGSLSWIAVLGDVIRGYLPVNLILLFVFVNMGIVLLRVYRASLTCN